MMERNYRLVAWTENITDNEKARLYMIPSLEYEVQASLCADLTFIHMEENRNHGKISLDLAKRAIKAYESISRFEILTGHTGDGIRYIFFAAQYCCREDGSHRIRRELRYEFDRLRKEGVRLAKKYRREDILLERKPRKILSI